MTLSQIRLIVLTFTMILIVGWVGYFIGKHEVRSYGDVIDGLKMEVGSENTDNSPKIIRGDEKADMRLFWQVWAELEDSYLFQDKIDYKKMVYGAIEGMTSALGDPYTAFYPPSENQTSKENLNGQFFGVGIQLGYKKDQLVVIAPISGMPAEAAGVKAGDYILKIVDEKKGFEEETYNMGVMDAVEVIRGEKGTAVKLTLLHEGESEPYEVEIIRDEIIVPSVEVSFGKVIDGVFVTENIDENEKVVAHLKLTRFGELTDDQWDKSIDEILSRGELVEGVVLDVRNNPGGYMQGAINLAAEFLPVGKVVVKQESSKYPNQEFKTERYGRLLTMPLVVLMNQGSASASEILAGALSEHNRAKLVGVTSFGKGTIQSVDDYNNGAGLHITIARWLTPEGNWIHEKGIEPDVKVEFYDGVQSDIQLSAAADTVLGREVNVEVKEASKSGESSQ